MVAAHGNNYAIGNSGRPSQYDLEKVGKDMIVWATNNPKALTVPQFAVSIGVHSSTMIRWCKENQEFQESYMIAKELIGINRLNSTMNQEKDKPRLEGNIYLKTIGNYDGDVHNYLHDEKTYEAELKADKDQKTTPIQINLVDYSREIKAKP